MIFTYLPILPTCIGLKQGYEFLIVKMISDCEVDVRLRWCGITLNFEGVCCV